VNVFDCLRDFIQFVAAGMKHRDVVSAAAEAVDDIVAGGPGTADNQRVHSGNSLASRLSALADGVRVGVTILQN
jgi:hypothetical protein